jgi:hypothetical protein
LISCNSNSTYLKTLRNISVAIILALLVPIAVDAQDEDKPVFPLDNFYAKRKKNAIRGLLKDIKFGASLGYGRTFFSHKLDGFGIFQRDGYAPRIFVADPSVATRYSDWVNNFVTDTLAIKPGNFLVNSDTAKLGFKGKALNIPFKLTAHYEFERYRIGGGYSWEYMSIGDLKSISYTDKIAAFRPDGPRGLMKKYFVLLGVSFFRVGDYLFTADANVGGFKPGKNFNNSLIKKGLFANVGVTVERDLSEYLKVFVRPSFEIKNYTISIPENSKSIDHSINAYYVNIGLSYSIPGLPKCYNKNCHVQMNHAHGDREYRSRMHKIWKWQNPNYGQNNPQLIKYKGKNKKKLNPY